jgi:hypothetical protein|tara:strand:+ start:525 stop:1001 length:477 start_codon:yes stop_codon:yes gene_type:complete
MKKVLIISLSFLSFSLMSEETLRLNCFGEGSNVSSSTAKITSNQTPGQSANINSFSRKEFNSKVSINLEDGNNWIEIPSTLMSGANRLSNTFKKQKNNKFDLYDIVISDEEIIGKFKLNFANKPSVKIDRFSGTMFFDGLGVSFNGECQKVEVDKKKF